MAQRSLADVPVCVIRRYVAVVGANVMTVVGVAPLPLAIGALHAVPSAEVCTRYWTGPMA
jgi:hypothetical protein